VSNADYSKSDVCSSGLSLVDCPAVAGVRQGAVIRLIVKSEMVVGGNNAIFRQMAANFGQRRYGSLKYQFCP